MVDQLHTFAKLSNIPCLRRVKDESIAGYDPSALDVKILDVHPKISENRLCQLKKFMIRVAAPQYRKKAWKECPSRWQRAKAKRIQNSGSRAPFLRPIQPESKGSGGCFESASMVFRKEHVVYKRLHYIRKPWAKYAQL